MELANPKPRRAQAVDDPALGADGLTSVVDIAKKDHNVDLIIISDSNPLKKNLYPLPLKRWEVYPKTPIPLIPKEYERVDGRQERT